MPRSSSNTAVLRNLLLNNFGKDELEGIVYDNFAPLRPRIDGTSQQQLVQILISHLIQTDQFERWDDILATERPQLFTIYQERISISRSQAVTTDVVNASRAQPRSGTQRQPTSSGDERMAIQIGTVTPRGGVTRQTRGTASRTTVSREPAASSERARVKRVIRLGTELTHLKLHVDVFLDASHALLAISRVYRIFERVTYRGDEEHRGLDHPLFTSEDTTEMLTVLEFHKSQTIDFNILGKKQAFRIWDPDMVMKLDNLSSVSANLYDVLGELKLVLPEESHSSISESATEKLKQLRTTVVNLEKSIASVRELAYLRINTQMAEMQKHALA